jgi:hypothetical protein
MKKFLFILFLFASLCYPQTKVARHDTIKVFLDTAITIKGSIYVQYANGARHNLDSLVAGGVVDSSVYATIHNMLTRGFLLPSDSSWLATHNWVLSQGFLTNDVKIGQVETDTGGTISPVSTLVFASGDFIVSSGGEENALISSIHTPLADSLKGFNKNQYVEYADSGTTFVTPNSSPIFNTLTISSLVGTPVISGNPSFDGLTWNGNSDFILSSLGDGLLQVSSGLVSEITYNGGFKKFFVGQNISGLGGYFASIIPSYGIDTTWTSGDSVFTIKADTTELVTPYQNSLKANTSSLRQGAYLSDTTKFPLTTSLRQGAYLSDTTKQLLKSDSTLYTTRYFNFITDAKYSDTTSMLLTRNSAYLTYLKNGDSTLQRNYSNSLYLKNGDSTLQRNYSNSLYLKNGDSTLQRNYSNQIYLKNADSTTLKNSLLKNTDSTSIRNYSNQIYLKNADSTSIRNYDNQIYLKNADSTTQRNNSNYLYLTKIGLAGGQTAYGGINASDSLHLFSTSNGTKGFTRIDNVLHVDPTNTRVGIGTAARTPTVALELGNTNTTWTIRIAGRSYVAYNGNTGGLVLQNMYAYPITFNVNNTTMGSGEIARFLATGQLAIGQTTADSSITTKHGVHIGNSLKIDNDLTYYLRHCFLSGEALSYTPAVAQNIYTKLVPGLTVLEADSITAVADSIVIQTPGSFLLHWTFTVQGLNGKDFTFAIRLNDVKVKGITLTTTGANNYISGATQWYFDGLVRGDRISFAVTNVTDNEDPTIKSMTVFCHKLY